MSNIEKAFLFGESLAAGFPFAPGFTPAMCLSTILKDSDVGVDVIDYSKVNLGPKEQLSLLNSLTETSVQYCIFLTGNNWFYDLKANDPEHLNVLLAERVQQMMQSFADFVQTKGAQGIFVIPPFHHQWPRIAPPKCDTIAITNRWFKCWSQICSFYSKFETYAAEISKLALQMSDLDNGSSPLPFQILSDLYSAQGDLESAARWAERAGESVNWQNITWALPQTSRSMAKKIKQSCDSFGFLALDLNERLKFHFDTPFLDSRVFVDQCHLTPEAMTVACKDIAETMFKIKMQPQKNSIVLTKSVNVGGHIQAANWNSLFYPTIEHYEQDSLRRVEFLLRPIVNSPLAREVAKDLVFLRSRSCPPELNCVVQRLSRVPQALSVLKADRFNRHFYKLLTPLITPDDLNSYVESEQAELAQPGVDLTDSYYLYDFWDKSLINSKSGFLESWWPKLKFNMISNGTKSLGFELIARGGKKPSVAKLLVNGKLLDTFNLNSQWSTEFGRILKDHLVFGLNEIELSWGQATIESDTTHNKVFACFGQVFSFRIYEIE